MAGKTHRLTAIIPFRLLPFLFFLILSPLSGQAQSLTAEEDRLQSRHISHVITNWQATRGQPEWINDPRLSHLAEQVATRFMQTGQLDYHEDWLREALAKVSFNAEAVAIRLFANETDRENFAGSLRDTAEGRQFIGDNFYTHMGIAYMGPETAKRKRDLQNVRIVLAARETRQAGAGWQQGLLEEVNKFRAGYGLSPLTMNSLLHKAAQSHADDMAIYDYFDHINLRGKGPGHRARQMGYAYEKIYENLATGQTGPDEVVEAWKKSKNGHREAMLVPDLSEVGFGYRFLPNDRGKIVTYHYWAMSMALPH